MQPPPPNYSNYYRPPSYGQGPLPPGPPEVSIDVIGQAWNMNFKELGTWLVSGLLYIVVTAVISYGFSMAGTMVVLGGLIPARTTPPTWGSIVGQQLELLPFNLISAGLVMPLTAGFLDMVVRRMEGQQVSAGDMFQGYTRFGPLFLLGIANLVVMWIGFLLFIIPGFYLLGALAFAPIICFRQQKGAFEAMGASMQVLKGGQAFYMFLVLFVIGVILLAGAFCCVGIFFVFPIYMLAIGITYYNFFPPQMPQAAYGAPAPPYGPQTGYGMTPPPPTEYPSYPPQQAAPTQAPMTPPTEPTAPTEQPEARPEDTGAAPESPPEPPEEPAGQ